MTPVRIYFLVFIVMDVHTRQLDTWKIKLKDQCYIIKQLFCMAFFFSSCKDELNYWSYVFKGG